MPAAFAPDPPEQGIYQIAAPLASDTTLFLNSPHSGDHFPAEFLARAQLPRETLRRASDLFVDRLFMPATEAGVPMMRALLPRSYVDLNREPFELDPRLIAGPLPVDANTRSLRVAGGLGTVPRVIGDQIEIYAGKISLDDALRRIEQAYVPYHLRLHRELALRHQRHGRVVLVDLHSMPSQSGPRPARPLPDLVLGDRFGASADPDLVEAAEAAARGLGFRVERNQPYAGGYITEHYGRPALGWHAFQIEINRALYMDEQRLEPHGGFAPVCEALVALILRLMDFEAYASRTTALHFSQDAAE
ncbi:MAG: N-formylglutamate amidohydrolase [Hyphomicrobiales bacterium]|nr:N-formylglutamate amidohydrolase [Hyphomicrobiales bacterium]